MKEHPVFSRRWWFQGRPIHGAGVSDIGWFTPDGAPIVEKNWGDGFEMSFAVFLNGEALTFPGPRRERIAENSFYLIFNTCGDSQLFRFPSAEFGTRWEKVLDTCEFENPGSGAVSEAAGKMEVAGRSMNLFRRIP